MSARRCKCGEPVEVPDGVATALVDAAGSTMCIGCFATWKHLNPAPQETEVMPRETKYVFTFDMGEISGFGGGYEQTCRNMLAAGLEWLDAHPKATPQFHGYEGVFGILSDDNDDAKALSDAVIDGSDGDCSGAMHQAVVSSCLWIHKNGWDKYCGLRRQEEKAIREREGRDANS